MEWSQVHQNMSNVNKIKKLQRDCLKISDALFQNQLFLKPETVTQVLSYLSANYALNTQRNYCVALNNCYGSSSPYTKYTAELNVAQFNEKKTQAQKPIDSKEVQQAKAAIARLLVDPAALMGVKVMCALLRYGIDVSLLDLINATTESSANYYDGTAWVISGKQIQTNKDFNAYMTFMPKHDYVVTDTRGKKYERITSLSKSFVHAVGLGFIKVKHLLQQYPYVTSPKLKLKLKVQVEPLKGIEWSVYDDPLIRPASNALQRRNVKLLVSHLVSKDDQFYPKAFESGEAMEKIKTFMESPNAERDGKTYTLETRLNFINALCKFLHSTGDFNALWYNKYCAYRDELKVKAMQREKSSVLPFPSLLPNLTKMVTDIKKVAGFRILCSMIVNNINLADDEQQQALETTGVLRMSDLKNTRIQDDGEHSYLDLAQKKWHIQSKFTKNKKGRTLDVPDNFIADIKAIYQNKVPEWLLLDKSGQPYENLSSLTNMFRVYLGVKFTDIRASYTTYRHTLPVTTVGEIKKLSTNMGHSMRTVQAEYLRA